LDIVGDVLAVIGLVCFALTIFLIWLGSPPRHPHLHYRRDKGKRRRTAVTQSHRWL